MLKDNREDMEIERPFEHLSNDELWNAIRKRRTSPKQRNLQLELIYRFHHLEFEVERLKDYAEDCQAEIGRQKEDRKLLEKLYYGG